MLFRTGLLSFSFLLACLCTAFTFESGKKEKGITAKETIEFLNKKIDPTIRFELKKGGVMVSFFRDDVVFRQDLYFPEDQDVKTVKYIEEEGVFSIKCFKGSKCVDRNLIEQGIRREYGRFSIPYKGDAKSVESIRQAFVHLIRNAQENKYSRTEPFE